MRNIYMFQAAHLKKQIVQRVAGLPVFRTLAFLLTLVAFPSLLFAATKTWTGASSTSWSTAANWSPSGVPLSGDVILIPGGLANYPVVNSTVTANTISVNSSGTGGSLTVTSGGSLTASGLVTVKAGGNFYQTAGTSSFGGLTLNGTADVSGGTILSDVNLVINSGGVLNQSAGLIHLANATGTSPSDHLSVFAGGTVNQSGGTMAIKDWGTSGGTFNQTGATALLKVQQSWTPGAGSVFNSTAGTVEFTGSATNKANFASGTRQFTNIIVDAGVDPHFDQVSGSYIYISGNFTNNNTTLNNTANAIFWFNGTTAQTIYSASSGTNATFGYLIIENLANATVSLTSNAYVAADTYVNEGTLDIGAYISNRRSAGGLLQVSAGATLIVKGTTGGVTGSNFPSNYTTVTLAATSTVEFGGPGQTVPNYAYGNLTFSSSSGAAVKTMPATALAIVGNLTSYKGAGTSVSFTAASALTVSGSVNIGASTTFVGGSFSHSVAGDWTNSGTFTPTGNTIIFNGTIDQAITTTSAFNNVTVNKTTGAINLSSDVTVNTTLTFTKGLISTGSYKVAMGTAGVVSGAATVTGWVYGNLQKYSATGNNVAVTFQVGGSLHYSPVSITYANVSVAGYLIVKATPSSHPSIGVSTMATKNIGRYWTLSKPVTSPITYNTATITFNWNTADKYSGLVSGSLKVASYAAAAWLYPTTGTTSTTSAAASGVAITGDFAVGEITACTISSGFTYSATNFCSNGGTISKTLNVGATAGTFTSSPAGLSISSSTGAITLGASTVGTYTITNTAVSGGCTSASSVTITITAAPSASISYSGGSYCASAGTASVTRTGTTGGVYSSTTGLNINSSTGAITLSNSTPGTYTVTYTVAAANGCSVYTTTAMVTVVAQPSATISYDGTPYCLSGGSAAVSRGGTAGGTYTSTAGLVISSSTGAINLTSSSAGTYTVTYTVAAANGCSVATATTSVTLSTSTATSISYTGSPFCKTVGSALVNLSGATGGVYTSTVGLDLDATTGEIDPSNSTAGTYTITYTVVGTCTVVATTTVTITAAPTATISYSGTPYCTTSSSASVTRTGTAGGTYTSTSGLSINSSTGDINISLSTAGTYTVTYTIAAAGGCSVVTATTSVTIITAATWTGAVSTNWSATGNWSCSTLPTSTSNVVIPAGLTRYPIIAAADTGTMNNITIPTGGSLTVIGKLQVAGTITAASQSIVADSGTLIMNGSSAQTVTSGIFNNELSSLRVNNTAGVTLGGALKLNDILTIQNGALTTGGYLTLKSTVYGTARVGAITSASGTPIIGNVTVERYVPGRRKYRLITSPVTTSTSSTLSVGQESQSIWGNWQNGGVATSGVGTIITGGATTDGFDAATTNASLYTYNDATKRYVAFTSANGKNTKYTPLKAGVAYYMFVYGDRLNSVSATSPNPTTLKQTGTLLTGDQVYNTTTTIPISGTVGRYSLLGNPYACMIDWKSVSKTNVSKTIWGWDANLSSTGGYVTVTATTLGALISPVSTLIAVSRYVQPGQGFFVQTTGASPSVTIREQDKIDDKTSQNSNVFRTGDVNAQPLMAINLLYNNGVTTVLNDGAVVAFDSSFTNAVGEEDGLKFVGTTEGIAMTIDTNLVAINARKLPTGTDTLALNLTKLTRPQYTLQIFANGLTASDFTAVLHDKYLNTKKTLSLVDTNYVNFTINTADAASIAADRFLVVLNGNSGTLPVTFTGISAARKDKNIEVKWDVATESGIQKYVVQKSVDGVNFKPMGEVAAKGNNNSSVSYNWTDVNPVAGNNYYQVKSVQLDGKLLYSKVVYVRMENRPAEIKVFPNPIKDRMISLQITDAEVGSYRVGIFNAYGQRIFNQSIEYKGGSSNFEITLDKKVPVGMYYLRLSNESAIYNQTIIIQ
jgi:hypothetical protein